MIAQVPQHNTTLPSRNQTKAHHYKTRRHGENQSQRQTLYRRGHGGNTEVTEEIRDKKPNAKKNQNKIFTAEEEIWWIAVPRSFLQMRCILTERNVMGLFVAQNLI